MTSSSQEAPAGSSPVRGSRLAQAAGEEFSLSEAVGGPRGLVEAVLPGLLFVVWFTVTRDLRDSLVAALAAAALLVVARLVTRSNATQALGGLVGVAVCAWAASRTGEAADFYLPGFALNGVYATAYALSTARLPKVGPLPVMGLVIGPLVGEGLAWRRDPRRLQVYRRATWLWVAMFVLRLAVQVPLYLADAVAALGIARLVMGVPLFALTAWFTWLLLRRVPVTRAAPAAPAVPPRSPRQ